MFWASIFLLISTISIFAAVLSGPNSVTTNAVPRFVNNKTLKNSGVVIDDSDNITGINQLSAAIFSVDTLNATNIYSRSQSNGFFYAQANGLVVATNNGSGLTNIPVTGISTPSALVTNGFTPDITFVGNVQAKGFSVTTNLWATNSVIGMGTNYTCVLSANTGGGITGIAGTIGSTEQFGQITIESTGDVVFTNPAAFYTSDGVDTRTFTNGNLTTVVVQRIPGLSTNLIFSWSR